MMCANYVYKRRRLRNSVALLPKENSAKSCKPREYCNSNSNSDDVHQLLTMNNDDLGRDQRNLNTTVNGIDAKKNSNHRSIPVSLPPKVQNPDSYIDGNVVLALASVPEDGFHVPKRRLYKQYYVKKPHKSSDHDDLENESCSSSKSNLEQFSGKNQDVDLCECSSSGVKSVDGQIDRHPSEKFCIDLLKNHGLIGGSWPLSDDVSLDILGGNGNDSFRHCNICGIKGLPQKMLICDICEEAFHMTCCRIKEAPRADWYCQPCRNKNPRPLLDVANGKLFPSVGEAYKRRILQQELGPIQFMLVDTQPYNSSVRVGKDFQVEIPERSGPTADEPDHYFDEPSILDMECKSMKDWNSNKTLKTRSIGNWLQCREIIFNGRDDNDGVVCGKWRRAPLFATQTDDWDCSCSVVWDPFHADCAVPQELETEEVLRHLKYVELLRTRLNKKRKSG